MKHFLQKLSILLTVICSIFIIKTADAQTSNQSSTNGVTTYVNPIQPGEHPDQTLLQVGTDFYSTGSSFHFTPYVPILHSTDLVHWEVIARVVPANWAGLNSDAPAAGIWQGALAYFNNKYWVYFSNSNCCGQYFCNATNPAGPWSAPTQVTGSTVTGYDNSIFVDDDGTPYMLMKNGQAINLIQQIDPTTGQLTGTLLNLDWVNTGDRYSWAEGPVMCKRNGIYYYFVAGNVTGGQYVLSSPTLTDNQASWSLLGNFFSNATSPGGLTGPNHISQPIELADGTWWCLSHSYDNSGWYGQGRLGLLHQVIWDANGTPQGVSPNTNPVEAPNLPNTPNYMLNLPKADLFGSTTLSLDWHFFNKAMTTNYSLTANPGSMTLNPGTGTTHILQKEGGHYYSMLTKVTINPTATGEQAGLRMTNGDDNLFATLYAGYNGGKKIGFAFNGSTTEVANTIGNTVWLKIERVLHSITGYYSADGKTWTQVGGAIDVSTLDAYSTTYDEWVGTSIGLYATGISAYYDLFVYKDGFTSNPLAGYNNYYGVTTSTQSSGTVVTNSNSGDWLMLGGVSMDFNGAASSEIIVNAASASGTGSLQVWIDNIGGNGTQIATIPITSSGGANVWKNYTANINATGQHDLYFKFIGAAGIFSLNTVTLQSQTSPIAVALTSPANNANLVAGGNITLTATATTSSGSITEVAFYEGTTLIGTATTSPYTIKWSGAVAGTYSLTAVATNSATQTNTSSSITVNVIEPIYSTTTAPTIDGVVDALWSNYPASNLNNIIQGTVSSSTYLSANWKASWDANNLYVLVTVKDDVLVNTNQPVATIYDDDGIELYIDMGNTKTTTYGTNQFKYSFRWNDATIYELQNNAITGVKLGQTSQGITAGCTTNCAAIGYTMEISIPWTTLGVTAAPAIGSLEGFDVAVNDDDTGTRNAKISWNMTADNDYQDPADFGAVIMEGSPCTLPTATITPPGTVSFCTGGSVVLNANTGTGLTYQWNNAGVAISGATAASYIANAAGTYTVAVTSAGCTATSTTTTVTANTTPAAPTVTTPVSYCLNTPATALTATGTALIWYTAATGGMASTTAPTPVTTTATTTNYYVSQTTNNCESPRATIAVTVNALPVLTPYVQLNGNWLQQNTVQACAGTTISLGPQPAVTTGWSWTGPSGYMATTRQITLANLTTTQGGVYTANYTDANGCKASSNFTVTVNAIPSAPGVISPVTYCQGATATALTATTGGGGTLNWYGTNATEGTASATAPTPLTNATGSTTYYVSQTVAGCEGPRASETVTVNALPIATIIPATSTTFCSGGSVVLNATTGTGLTYQWSNGGNAIIGAPGSSYTATMAGAYTVTITNISNCTATSSGVTVTVDTPPSVSIAGSAQYITTTTATLAANTPTTGTGSWSVVSGTATFANSASATTSASGLSKGANVLQWTISNGTCPASIRAVTINVGTNPVSQTISGKTDVTTNETEVIYSIPDSSGSTYHWTLPAGATITSANGDSSSITVSFGTTGSNVSVVQTNPYGSATSTLPVSVGNAPISQTISGKADVTTNEIGVTYSIPDSTGSTYHWVLPTGTTITSANADSSSITVSFGNTGGNISVTQTNPYGSAISTLPVSVGNPPTSQTIIGPDSVTANQIGVTYSVLDSSGSLYHWTLPAGATITSTNADSSSITVTFGKTGGSVSVTQTNSFGTATSTLPVSISSTTTAVIIGTTGDSYKVYPNPFSDHTTVIVHSAITEPITLTVINLQGVTCYSSSQYTTNQEFTIGSELTADGVYFVQLAFDNEVKVLKIVKMR